MTTTREYNLGPLTTPFTYPSSCSYAVLGCSTCSQDWQAWQAQTCGDNGYEGDAQDNTDCWPPRSSAGLLSSGPLMGGGFYSPGIACPVGYTAACAATAGGHTDYSFQFAALEAETAIGCCPSGYLCDYLSYDNTRYQTCISVVSTGDFPAIQCYGPTSVLTQQTLPVTVAASETGVMPSATAASLVIIQSMTIKAPMFEIIHKRSDLPSSTESPASTSSTSTTHMSQPAAPLSTGAKAGIGIGAAAGGLILIGAAFLLFRRQRRNAQQTSSPGLDETLPPTGGKYKAELPGHTPPAELDGSRGRAELA